MIILKEKYIKIGGAEEQEYLHGKWGGGEGRGVGGVGGVRGVGGRVEGGGVVKEAQ